jgi:acetoin utilization protein AcuC
MCKTAVLFGDELAKYGFGSSHPLNNSRIYAFWNRLNACLSDKTHIEIERPVIADEETILSFHEESYVSLVKQLSKIGSGYLDAGDTPAFKGVFEAASMVVGSSLKALELVVEKKDGVEHAFNPIGGLHHAYRANASGFCVFNDIGIMILQARKKYKLFRIAYVDIDAHHGDGVYYEFEDDPLVFIADIHEDGKYLFPGTGSREENGRGEAEGTKLNLPMSPGSTDKEFIESFKMVEKFVSEIAKPDIIIFQCGSDCIRSDPLTHLQYSPYAHKYAANCLHKLAHKYCGGRIIALGGGGYNLTNIGDAWSNVVLSFLKYPYVDEDHAKYS